MSGFQATAAADTDEHRSGMTWASVMEMLQAVQEIGGGLSREQDPALVNAATLHGLLLLAQGYALNVIGSAERPRFVSNFNWPYSSLGNCPDTTYYYTPVDARGVYRIWGRRNNIHMVDFQIGEAFYGTEKGGTNKSLVSLDLNTVPMNADGEFELILSSERPKNGSTTWYPMPAKAETITLRQVAYDWQSERQAEIHIERLDSVPRGAPSAEQLQAQVRAIARYAGILAKAPFGAKLFPSIRSREGTNRSVELTTFGGEGGLADQYYYVGAFDLQDDEALIIETDVPAPCRYWNIQLCDEFNAALDYIYHHSSLNGSQARLDRDGRFRAVIAHRDPGVANWLDTGGVQSGLVMGRWKEAGTVPALPKVTKVSFDRVAEHLPPGTAFVSAAEREATVRMRRDAMLRRLGY